MDDLIKRLESAANPQSGGGSWDQQKALLTDAAAALSEAQAENARLREALRQIAVMGFDDNDKVARRIGELAVVQARAALSPRGGEG